MVVLNPAKTEAQSSQVPPELRIWASTYTDNAGKIERYGDEKFHRSWKLRVDQADTVMLPDKYEVTAIFTNDDGSASIHIKE